MSKTLRYQYNNKNIQKNKLISSTAYKWLEKNVIVINEKIDRRTVSRLIKSIQKFEDTFGPYKDKLPTISQHLDAAEQGLQLVITGKSSERKTSNLLKQLGFLYSTFGDFFSRDLPVLLKTPLLKKAKLAADIPLRSLDGGGLVSSSVVEQNVETDSPTDIKIDIKAVEDTFANALKPSPQEIALLSKLYISTPLPQLNVRNIAKQMLDLSFNDLEELTGIGKIPKVVTSEEEALPENDEADSTNNLENISSNLGAPPGVPESFDRKKMLFAEEKHLEMFINNHTPKNVLIERIIKEASVEEMSSGVNALKGIVDKSIALEPLRGAVNDLQSKVYATLSDDNIGAQLANISKQPPGKAAQAALKQLFTDPKGKILAQANLAIETFENLAKGYAKISSILEKENVSAGDLVNIKKILLNSVKGGAVKQLVSFFKTKPFPGLTPDEIVNAVTRPLDDALGSAMVQSDMTGI